MHAARWQTASRPVATAGSSATKAAATGWGDARLAAPRARHDGLEESSTLLERLLVALGLRTFDDLIRWTSTANAGASRSAGSAVLNAERRERPSLSELSPTPRSSCPSWWQIRDAALSGKRHDQDGHGGGLLRPGSPLLTALRTNWPPICRGHASHLQAAAGRRAGGGLQLAAKLLAKD